MTKLLIFLFCGLLSVTGCTVKQEQDNASASLMASGTTGELTWELGEDGTLTISGKGEMPNYILNYNDESSPTPWYEYRDHITKAVIEDGVISIGDNAFSNCIGLKSITVSNTVSLIGFRALYGCIGLSEIITYSEIPPQFDNISPFVEFADDWDIVRRSCTVYVPAGFEYAYWSAALWGCFPKICAIGEDSGLVIDGGREHNDRTSFLFSWRLYDDGTLIIVGNALAGFDPRGGDAEFGYAPWCVNEEYRNSITTVLIEEGVSSIGSHAFCECSNLTALTIPSTILHFGANKTFSGCTRLAKIICHSVHPPITYSYILEDVNQVECVLYVPVGSEEAYRAAEGWKDFENIKAIQ